MNDSPTSLQLRTLFDYDRDSGILTWRVNRGNVKMGAEAGYVLTDRRGKKYRRVVINKKGFMVHNVIWCMEVGEWPRVLIDHHDGDGMNNKWLNLREATLSENSQNTRLSIRNTSGYKGVYFNKPTGKWYSRITVGDVLRHIGCFDSAVEAAHAYNKAAIILHGDFATLNPVGMDELQR